MKNFNYKNILVLGSSKKFIKFVKKNFNYNIINTLPWRSIKCPKNSYNKKVDLIIICGYDYNSSQYNYKKYFKINISGPYNVVKNYYKKETIIIYINTIASKKYTLSRYYYAKHKLNEKLAKNFNNFISIELPIIINNGHVDVFGSAFTKIVFKTLIFLKILKYIEYRRISFEINNKLKNNSQAQYIKIKGKFLKFPRNLFLDRVLRLI